MHWLPRRLGGAFLCLLALGLALELRSVHRLRRRARNGWSALERAALAQSVGRLLGLAAPAVTIALYTLSSASAFAPWIYSRYLISVSIAPPAALAGRQSPQSWRKLAGADWLVRVSVIWLSAFLLVALGVIGTYRVIDAQQAQNQVRADLVAYLTQPGHTRVYTEFWTCYWVIFQSDERVICGVLNADWSHRPSRYAAYDLAIQAAQPSTYVLPLHSIWADTFDGVATQRRWRIEQKMIIDQQYVVFVVAPLSP
jgi:hypothetical protein